jgi:ABC-type nitrate/sulfonate/bicarbonate transport system permease component
MTSEMVTERSWTETPMRVSNSLRHRGLLAKVISVVIMVIVWQAAVSFWLPAFLPTPLGVVEAIPATVISAVFLSATGETLLAILAGTVIGCLVGTVLGLMSGRVVWLRQSTLLYINGLYALPLLAIVPPVTIWLGYTSDARLALVILAAFLPCAVSATDGSRSLPPELVEVVDVFRASPFRRFFDLILPGSLPFVVAGLHVAVGRAIIAAVSVEFIAGLNGIGTFILLNARSYHQNEAFVGVILLAVLGASARFAILALLERVAPWHVHAS